MQTFASCMQCQIENKLPNWNSFRAERIPDDGVIELTCDRGHQTFIILQQTKYEILSELAVKALSEGYYREAVTSFASALERLYEHYIDVVCRAREINRAEFAKAWKPLRKASERQLGAFAILYLAENGKAFPLLDQTHVSFRNNVIHAGLIPSRAEALAYGQAVCDCALPLIALLHSTRYTDARQNFIFDSLHQKSERARAAGHIYSTQFIITPFSSSNIINLEELVKKNLEKPNINDVVTGIHTFSEMLAKSALRPKN